MKKIATAICTLIYFIAKSQNPIPNPGFESWDNPAQPTGWTNSAGIVQTTQSHTGTYAAKGLVTANNTNIDLSVGTGNGIPVTHNFGFITFSYIFTPVNGDVLEVEVFADNGGGTTIGGVTRNITLGTTQFITVSYPISVSGSATDYTIDFVMMDKNGGFSPTTGSFFIIDDVSLSTSISSISDPIQNELDLLVAPNPAKDWINIHFSNFDDKTSNIQIYNTLGQLVKTEQLTGSNTQMSVADLLEGLYILAVKQEESVVTKKIQIIK
ncbi:MAG: hypothetical protein JWO06_2572 [Bacteroidota bacterium]|nr:hypothetical protein [Bacteroidota bacterium]